MKETTFLELPSDVYQTITSSLEAKDLLALRESCTTTRDNVSKLPVYKGTIKKDQYLKRVQKQESLLFKQKRSGQDFFQQLIADPSKMPLYYQDLLNILNGDFLFDSKYPVINQIRDLAKKGRVDLLPLIARLKLEIIKKKPIESDYFLHVHNEDTNFDYTHGYYVIALSCALGAIAGVASASALGAAYYLGGAAINLMLPYLIVGAAVALICFAVAGHYGSQHQRGLHQFVLNEDFLCEGSSLDTLCIFK